MWSTPQLAEAPRMLRVSFHYLAIWISAPDIGQGFSILMPRCPSCSITQSWNSKFLNVVQEMPAPLSHGLSPLEVTVLETVHWSNLATSDTQPPELFSSGQRWSHGERAGLTKLTLSLLLLYLSWLPTRADTFWLWPFWKCQVLWWETLRNDYICLFGMQCGIWVIALLTPETVHRLSHVVFLTHPSLTEEPLPLDSLSTSGSPGVSAVLF